MTTRSSRRQRLISVFGLLLMVLPLTPLGVNAQTGSEITPAETAFIEVHVSSCEPGSPTDPAQLKTLCHENGMSGVKLSVTSVGLDPVVSMPEKVTVRVNDVGPGIINTDQQPIGTYRIEIEPTLAADSFVFHCELRNSDTVVPIQPDPNGARNAFLVETTAADDVVCDVYVKIGSPTIAITYRECSRADLPGDSRTFADLNPNCTTVSTDPPTFNVRDLNTAGQPVTPHQLEQGGTLKLTLKPGSYDLFTDLDMENWGEYLFCEYPGQAQYQKNFHPERGIVTFTDLANEQITCNWFGVSATSLTQGQMVPPPVTNDPPAENPGAFPASINFTLRTCASDDAVSDVTSLDLFRTNCPTPTSKVDFSGTNDTVDLTPVITDDNGKAAFTDLAAGTWRVWSSIPLEAATEYYFCDLGDGAFAAQLLSDRGAATFNVVDSQTINCEVYVVPENLRGDITGASVEVHLAVCPVGYDGSDWYNTCHGNGVGEMPFTLQGPAGEQTVSTVVEATPGPGIARFTALPAGDYTLLGGPPQDFGTVFLYCSDPANGNARVDTVFENYVGKFTLAENQSIICDWYFTPDDQGMETPTPTPDPKLAEIYTTMFVCPTSVNVAGSSFGQLDDACAETKDGVLFTLNRPAGVPVSAYTGDAGAGAIRFKELVPGDYVLTPSVPADFVSAAVYCDLNGGNVYQKVLSNGGTKFVNVEGELISCSWFIQAKPAPQPGPTGSITIREMLCTGDRSTIKDWERDCQPGSSGVSFTVTAIDGSTSKTLTPNAQGVAVFSGLPNMNYEIKQSQGAWCRAQAERVDSQSRVGVANGGNTDVFIYQCNQQIGLPSTGAGPAVTDATALVPMLMGAAALPLFGLVGWQVRRSKMAPVVSRTEQLNAPQRTSEGYRYH
ncbi:MAG: hypothetical protein M9950_10345 [Thermomicrobiales bacterium]|nr:hypothetical protein [Thermomicrobiales bacterium]